MKKTAGIFTLIALVAMIGITTVGCDNRSQLEKDADKAAKKLEKKANDIMK